jgi:hypothetical protein
MGSPLLPPGEQDAVVEFMQRHNIPLMRENYIKINFAADRATSRTRRSWL